MVDKMGNESFWKAALESAGQGVWHYDIRTGQRDYSDVWHQIRGLIPGAQVTATDEEWLELVHPEDRMLARDRTSRLNAGELAEVAYEYRERHAQGHWVWIMCRGQAVEWDEDGKPYRFVGTDTDITRLKASEDQVRVVSRRLELALSSVQIGVWQYDVTRDTIEWDRRLRSIYGLAEGEELPRNIWEQSLHPDDSDRVIALARNGLEQRTDYQLSYRIIRRDGAVRFLYSRVSYQEDLIGGPIMVGINWDATEEYERSVALETANRLAAARNAALEAARAEMEYNALCDTLTGLPNRRKFDQVQREHQSRPTGRTAILHIDLDRFKLINDVFGHSAGDFVLCKVAEILSDCVPDGTLVARVGGDEFAVFFADAPDDENLSALASRMIERAARPVFFEGKECRYGISVGIAVAEGDNTETKSLFVHADQALYQAKNEGRGRFCFFRRAMQTEAMAIKHRADEMLSALERDEFFCVYQPQFCAKTLHVTGVEALVRWQTKTLGVLKPDSFLTLAEDMNLMARVDQIVLQKATADFRAWAKEGLSVPRLSVNVSKSRLRDPNLARELSSIVNLPGRLSLELLESNFLDVEDKTVSANIAASRAAGIEIEVDDFGTGHSSIVSLLRLKPNRLKIDRALVEDIDRLQTNEKLTRSIIEIGHLLNASIIAEGVENERQITLLQDIGCDELQGFALSKPLRSDELIHFLRRRSLVESGANVEA